MTRTLRLRVSRGRCLSGLGTFLLFFILVLRAHFPASAPYLALRLTLVPVCLLGMGIFIIGFLTDRFDAILTPDGIKYGTFSGKRLYLWNEIKAIHVLPEITGRKVFIELNDQDPALQRVALQHLPDTYGMDADELANTLLQWQREHGSRSHH